MIDNVNHPAHYKASASGIETIEVTRLMGFSLGNAVKYISRRDHKGNTEEDLKKAVWYLKDAIKYPNPHRKVEYEDQIKVYKYVAAEENKYAQNALKLIANYHINASAGRGVLELAIHEVEKIYEN